jgi:diguanylate cyclase (GGDEF)-like protein
MNKGKSNTPVSVLRSLATITGQRDRDLLAKSLISTLSELIHSKRISMYRILPTEEDLEAILITQSSSGHEADLAATSVIISSKAEFQTVLNTGKEYLQNLDDKTCLSIYPITDKHNIVGLLEMVSAPHSEIDNHLISSFLMVYSNYLSILNESETDTLTGLLNRRTFENNLEKIIAERSGPEDSNDSPETQYPARRNYIDDLPHWLAVMDIDHFKRINDEFGHLYGDEVLLLLSRIMKSVFRQSDKLFRFGGEEFIVVLDRTNVTNAKNALERFRIAIENYHFPQVGRVTISIGFVCLDKPDVPSSIIGRADQSLYYAKGHGRNQVCYYDELITKGELASEHFSNDVELF